MTSGRVNRMKDTMAMWGIIALFAVLTVGPMGYCGYALADCNARGGSLVKNYFGWPTCINAKR